MGSSPAIIPPYAKVRPIRGSGKTKETQSRPCINAADGFMKSRFLPLLKSGEQFLGNKMEADFKQSVAFLAAAYGIEPLDMNGMKFPYNIAVARWDMENKLRCINSDIDLHIVKDDESGTVSLATVERVNTGHTLYYIPIVPLYVMLRNRKKKRCATWLMVICSYMLRETGIPMCYDDCSIADYYEAIGEYWKSSPDDWGENGYSDRLHALNEASLVDTIMRKKIANPYHLKTLKQRLGQFVPANRYEQKCYNLAQQTYHLWRQYPNRSLFEHIDFIDYDDDVIGADTYISFVARTDDILGEELERWVNEEYNSCGVAQEPLKRKVYDKPCAGISSSLDFERRVFRLIKKLTTLINEVEAWKI